MKLPEKKADDIDIQEYIALEEELHEARKQYGAEKKEGKLSHLITRFLDGRENRVQQLLDRKKYLLLAVFTGWFGGHRFYAKQYPSAILYLLFFWSGFPMAMTIIDLMIAIPKQADEDGKILL